MKAFWNNIEISQDVVEASTIRDRCLGLMFKKALPSGESLLLSPCNSIHTFFMRFSIDVLFLDNEYKIVKVFRSLGPWRITLLYLKARHVLELPGGSLPEDLKEGEALEFRSV